MTQKANLRRDIEKYAKTTPISHEGAQGAAPSDWADLADDTDWDAEWPDSV